MTLDVAVVVLLDLLGLGALLALTHDGSFPSGTLYLKYIVARIM
jgi:hypothetical protein